MKSAVIYYSMTGNTQMMAEAVREGMGSGADIFEVQDITVQQAREYDFLALGCPAMGSETLEDDYFEPFIDELYKDIKGKKVALFGSYGWGDGEYMDDWEERTRQSGAQLCCAGLTINEQPDDDGLQKCRELGKNLIES